MNPLLQAVDNQDLDQVKRLGRVSGFTCGDYDRALTLSIKKNNTKIFLHLIDSGAMPDDEARMIAKENGNVEIVEKLNSMDSWFD